MEDVISKLAEIEAAASRIMEDVAVQKKGFPKKMMPRSKPLTRK